jgi:hypothetical protein
MPPVRCPMRLETSPKGPALVASALGAAALVMGARAAAAEPKLLVFLHLAIKQRAFQSELSAALPGISVTAVGRIADFARALADAQDAVLTLPVVLAAHGLTAKLRGVRAGSAEELYSLVASGKTLEPTQLASVGALDLLGREGTTNFVQGLLNAKPKVERVTKVEDLLALLQMQRVDAILLPSRLFEPIQEGSRLPLNERPLPSLVGLPAVASVGPLAGQVLPAFGRLPVSVKQGLGVDEWR